MRFGLNVKAQGVFALSTFPPYVLIKRIGKLLTGTDEPKTIKIIGPVDVPIQNNPNARSIGIKHFMRACGARVAKETGPETQPGLAKPVVENRMGSTGIRASVRISKKSEK